MTRALHLVESELLSRISAVLENVPEVYLVGGAVRDSLLGKPVHDLDFVLNGDVRTIARRVADSLNAAFYMLDEQRSTARVIFHRRPQAPVIIDFATLRAPDLDGDLRARDFTINAMAHSLGGGGQLIDPLGGVADLRAKTLRACSASTFEDDPVRILRGVRLGLDLQFQIPSQTSQAMRSAVPELQRISPERLRDELFRMLAGARPAVAIRLLDRLGVIAILLPELGRLKQVQQPSPHQMDVWQHTLATVGALEKLFEIARGSFDDDAVVSPYLGMAATYLARFRNHFSHEYAVALNPHRSARSLLCMAALYHHVGKPAAMSADDSGTIHYYNYESIGAELALARAQSLALSQVEALRIASIIRSHTRVHSMLEAGDKASRRAIYRFFRDSGA
ncbi:MAG: hypothetical protein U1B80_00920, partial [Anaerolineaceae bacterium]|nr:hypothetical protein [Anaerolineaceae bacterium]